MKGYRFYAEMQEARQSKAGSKRWLPFTRATLARGAERGELANCLAVALDENGRPTGEALASVYEVADAPVCVTGCDPGYLRERCVRIPAALARKLHPELFRRLTNVL